MNMEEIIKSIVNLGIGVVKTVEDGFQINATDLQGILAELVAKGDQAQDENAMKVKELVDQLIQVANDGEAQARELLDSVVSSLSEVDISSLTTDLQAKIQELIDSVRGNSNQA